MEHATTPPVFAGYAAIIAVFLAMATVTLGLRLWVRRTITRSIARDDYTLTLSHVANIAAGTVWLQAHIYAARFAPYSSELSSYLSLREVVAIGLILSSSALNKASIASFFLKIAHKRWQRWAILMPFWMYVIFLVVALMVIFLRCGVPINGTRIITATDCPVPRDIFNTLGSIMACLNSLCDWAFAFVPLRMVIGASRMDVTSKMSAAILIVLAVSSSFISLARVPFFARGDSFEPHTIYNTVHIFLLSVVENAVGVAVISVATLKPLLGVVRNGSLARRPSMAPILPQHRKGRNAKAVPVAVPVQKPESHMTDNFDWQVLRGIGILPNPNAGLETIVHFVDEEGRAVEEDGYDLPKKPHRVVVKVTKMASIDEVMHSHSATDSATTL
ncbi:hypothetical protein K461DRAFT_135769 [Myriangium duriaei CBS 260.36]|uniref:Rhodopsin domain-containing protein n=1 Tax=Myriangium duriaei CBS 260.36 TaxID=1168546 RepID=A0A9P4J4M9_9PEZI|nr:hypothetical protein K461DRAFT_135769 [Myriangium duriaei CBS 260.36]